MKNDNIIKLDDLAEESCEGFITVEEVTQVIKNYVKQ